MLYLLTLEWKKWYRTPIFRTMMAFYIVLLPGILLAGKALPRLPPPIGTTEVLFIFPTVWEYLGYAGNWLSFFFFGFLSVLVITTEYSYRTLRQSIINGLSRKEFFLGKVYFLTSIAVIATVYYFSCGLVIGYFNTDLILTQKVFQNIALVPRYFLMILGYMTFGMFLGFLVKHSGIALFLYLSYIMFLEPVIRWAIHRKIIAHSSMNFYPMNAVEDLVPAPYTDVADQFLNEYGFNFFLSPSQAAITTIIYSALFLYLSYRIMVKSDL